MRQIAKRTHSDELILQLIRSKTANQFTEEDIKNLRNKYHKVLELNRLAELMDSICSIKKSDRSDIEKDIVDFSGYEDPFSQTDERLKIALRMLKNYNKKIPDEIKQKAHDEIKNSLKLFIFCMFIDLKYFINVDHHNVHGLQPDKQKARTVTSFFMDLNF